MSDYVLSYAVCNLTKAERPEQCADILRMMKYDSISTDDGSIFIINPNREDVQILCDDIGLADFEYAETDSGQPCRLRMRILIEQADRLIRTKYSFIRKDLLIQGIAENIHDTGHTAKHRNIQRALFYETVEDKAKREQQVAEALRRRPDIRAALERGRQ